MRRRRSPKTANILIRHAKKRALQRFAIEPSEDDLRRIVKDIQGRKAVFIERQSLVVTIWQVMLKDKPCVAAYDKKRKMIRTVMPLEYYYGRETKQDLADQPTTTGPDDP